MNSFKILSLGFIFVTVIDLYNPVESMDINDEQYGYMQVQVPKNTIIEKLNDAGYTIRNIVMNYNVPRTEVLAIYQEINPLVKYVLQALKCDPAINTWHAFIDEVRRISNDDNINENQIETILTKLDESEHMQELKDNNYEDDNYIESDEDMR
ncbi:MAG: hypothetical protein IJ848_01340 [Alphaproteobacteria bacterium]|nr:hypothetical protein [Alphaproteobacteria bacterium]